MQYGLQIAHMCWTEPLAYTYACKLASRHMGYQVRYS